jgi:MoxR-like ATPase
MSRASENSHCAEPSINIRRRHRDRSRLKRIRTPSGEEIDQEVRPEALLADRRPILYGVPGAGKTTLLRRLCNELLNRRVSVKRAARGSGLTGAVRWATPGENHAPRSTSLTRGPVALPAWYPRSDELSG